MDLSDDDERRRLDPVEGTELDGASGLAIEGENETLYTEAEWPMRRREFEGGESLGPPESVDFNASPCMFQIRMYDSSVPIATRLLSSENSMQVILGTS
jgi:hypothetical protein